MRTLFADFKKALQIWFVNLRAEAELKQSFTILIVGMMINNIAFTLVWILFFQKFGAFNGWQAQDVIGLQAMCAFSLGLGYFIAGGALKLPLMIDSGYFDNLLLTPGNLHLKIFASHIRVSSLGDCFYGIILSVAYLVLLNGSPGQIAIWILAAIPAAIVVANFTLFTGLISFYITDANPLAGALQDIMVGPSLYPSAVYNNVLRAFFIYVAPAIVIGSMPVEAVKGNSVLLVALIWALAIFWTCLSDLLLKRALKHYESANLIANRV